MTEHNAAAHLVPSDCEEQGPRLVWAIRESFLDYLRALDDTVVTVNGWVQDGVPEEFVFPCVTPVESGLLQTRGWVSITAHAGELVLDIRNPHLTLSPGWLMVHVERQPGVWIQLARARTSIGNLKEAVDSDAILNEVLLTLDGSELFGTVYGPGFRLSPLRLEGG